MVDEYKIKEQNRSLKIIHIVCYVLKMGVSVFVVYFRSLNTSQLFSWTNGC